MKDGHGMWSKRGKGNGNRADKKPSKVSGVQGNPQQPAAKMWGKIGGVRQKPRKIC
jgi:hypothetical protein